MGFPPPNLPPPAPPPPPPPPPGVLECRLAPGEELQIEVATRAAGRSLSGEIYASSSAVVELLGVPEGDEMERNVEVRMYRDTSSQYPDSVRVETVSGHLLGWVKKSDSALACQVVDAISAHVPTVEPRAVGRVLAFRVRAEVVGNWEPNEEPELESITLMIRDPAEVDPLF